MTNVERLPFEPDVGVMHQMVQALFRDAGQRGHVELGWTSQHHPHRFTGSRHFGLEQLDDLVDYAAQINATPNRNVYVSVGLRNENVASDRRASDSDVFAVTALKADFDAAGALRAALEIATKLAIPPNLITITGREPHERGQFWWVLEEPLDDPALARVLDAALAARLGGDSSVQNPSRLMRLAGSVAWPLKQGRVLELTSTLVDTATRAAPYTADEIKNALTRAGALETPREPAAILDFSKAEPTLDLESLLERAQEPGQWHRHALLAVAHLTGRGTPPDVAVDVLIPRLTLPGYSSTQTYDELRVMAEGAVKRGLARTYAPPAEEPLAHPTRDPFPLLGFAEFATLTPPQWRVDAFLPDRGFGVLYGASGAYKSFITLDLALSVAHGIPWRGIAAAATPVVYIAGEGRHGLINRIQVWREHRAGQAECSGFWLAPVAADFLDRRLVALIIERLLALPVRPKLVVVDTLARSFGSGNENDAKDMNAFVWACDQIAAALEAFVLAVHHTGKDSDKGARGSSVLRAAADVEIEITKTGERRASIAVTKQKDAEEPKPLYVGLISVESHHPATGEIVSSLLPVAEASPEPDADRLTRNQRKLLQLLDAGSGSLATLAARLGGADRSNLRRALVGLIDLGFVRLSQEGVYESVVISGAEENQ